MKVSERPLVLLDACCLINLFATEHIDEILTILPYRFATSRWVAENEVLAIARPAETGALLERDLIPPDRLRNLESLSILDLVTGGEVSDFVRFAADLDDGEASVCALAISHQGRVATDDRKALRLLNRSFPSISTIQTPEILFEWARLSQAAGKDIGGVLRRIRDRARFYPRRDAPGFEWWASFFA
jgi:hypothetical protein